MKLFNLKGRLISKNVSKYRIDWDKKSRSKIQFSTKQFLKDFWKNDIVYEEFPVFGSKMKIDFLNATRKIAVEVDGDQHEEFNPHFHNNLRLNYRMSLRRDEEKEDWLVQNGFKIARIKEKEINLLSEDFFKKTFKFNLV